MRALLALALLAAVPAFAQEAPTLRPGDASLDFSTVQPASSLYQVRMVEPQAQAIGTVTETATLRDGVLTVVTAAEVPMGGPPRRDSTRMAWPSLMPLSDAVFVGDEVGTAAFADGSVAGGYGAADAPLEFEFDLRAPVFPASALPLVVRALPLREGYEATVPTFSAKDRFKEAEFKVTGREDARRADGSTVSAWVVEQVGGGGLASQFPQRHVVDPDTRQILKTTFRPQPTMLIEIVPLTPEEAAAAEADAAAEAAAQAAALSAAPALRPGDATLATDALRSETASLTVKLVEPMQQDIGTETRTTTVDEAAGTITLTTKTSIPMAGQEMTSTLVAAYPSLAPISASMMNAGKATEYAFADGHVTGTDEGEAVDQTLDAPVFSNAWLPEVVRLLPFAEGYTATLRGFSSEDGEVQTLLTVTGQETTGDHTAWVVTAQRDDNPVLTFKVDAATRRLLGYGFSPQPTVQVEFVRTDG